MGWAYRLTAIAGLALAALGACGDGPDASAACAQIALTGNRTATDGIFDVSVLTDAAGAVGSGDADGEQGRLVTGDWVATAPSLSPDGSHVVVVRAHGDYESAGPGSTELWVVGADGSTPRQLTTGRNHDEPAWSPDGTQVAYSAVEDGHRTVAVVPAEGGEARTVVDVAGMSFGAPAWSPDGERLAVVGDDEGAPYDSALSVWTVAADGADLAEVVALEDAPPMDVSLDWHPDGASLLVSQMVSLADGSITSADITTGEVRQVADDTTLAVWSPRGDGVYYYTARDDHRWRLTYGVIEDGALVPVRSLAPLAAPVYPQYGLDVGACPAAR